MLSGIFFHVLLKRERGRGKGSILYDYIRGTKVLWRFQFQRRSARLAFDGAQCVMGAGRTMKHHETYCFVQQWRRWVHCH